MIYIIFLYFFEFSNYLILRIARYQTNTLGPICLETLRVSDRYHDFEPWIALTSTVVFNYFLFSCDQNNGGLFVGAARLLGLGQSALSLVSQTTQNYGKVFSCCLPSTCSSTRYLTFGSGGGTSKVVKFTPTLVNS